MNSFVDPVDAALEARTSRRRRLFQTVRGWLRAERSPRLIMIGLLGGTTLAAIGVGYGIAAAGIEAWPGRAFLSVMIAWPIFVLLLRWRAAIEVAKFRFGERVDHFVARDEDAELTLQLRASAEPGPWRRAFDEANARESGELLGNPLALLLIGGLTLGGWLIWELIGVAPGLLAEVMLDAEIIPSRLELLTSTTHGDWRTDAIACTGLHFFGLALAAAMVASVLPYLPGIYPA